MVGGQVRETFELLRQSACIYMCQGSDSEESISVSEYLTCLEIEELLEKIPEMLMVVVMMLIIKAK